MSFSLNTRFINYSRNIKRNKNYLFKMSFSLGTRFIINYSRNIKINKNYILQILFSLSTRFIVLGKIIDIVNNFAILTSS